MVSALWIAYLSWVESVRRRFFWISLAMSLFLLLLPAYVNAFSMGLQAFEVVAKEFGLTLMGLFSTSLALLLGCTAIPRDVERGSLHPLLCRPIARLSYVLGQRLGVLVQLTAMLVLGGAALMLGMFALNRQVEIGIASAVFGLVLESSLLASVALAASTVASPPLAAVIAALEAEGERLATEGQAFAIKIEALRQERRTAGHRLGLARQVAAMDPDRAGIYGF